jgi:hypothetical protein
VVEGGVSGFCELFFFFFFRCCFLQCHHVAESFV